MPKKSLLKIQESIDELIILLRKESHPKNSIRLQSLIFIKTERFEKRTILASHLGYSIRSMELWLKVYKDKGLEGMLLPDKRNKKQ